MAPSWSRPSEAQAPFFPQLRPSDSSIILTLSGTKEALSSSLRSSTLKFDDRLRLPSSVVDFHVCYGPVCCTISVHSSAGPSSGQLVVPCKAVVGKGPPRVMLPRTALKIRKRLQRRPSRQEHNLAARNGGTQFSSSGHQPGKRLSMPLRQQIGRPRGSGHVGSLARHSSHLRVHCGKAEEGERLGSQRSRCQGLEIALNTDKLVSRVETQSFNNFFCTVLFLFFCVCMLFMQSVFFLKFSQLRHINARRTSQNTQLKNTIHHNTQYTRNAHTHTHTSFPNCVLVIYD